MDSPEQAELLPLIAMAGAAGDLSGDLLSADLLGGDALRGGDLAGDLAGDLGAAELGPGWME